MKLDDSVEDYKILNYQITDDVILVVTATKTKKILMIQPRFFVVVRVIKKLPDGSYVEY